MSTVGTCNERLAVLNLLIHRDLHTIESCAARIIPAMNLRDAITLTIVVEGGVGIDQRVLHRGEVWDRINDARKISHWNSCTELAVTCLPEVGSNDAARPSGSVCVEVEDVSVVLLVSMPREDETEALDPSRAAIVDELAGLLADEILGAVRVTQVHVH